MLAIYSRAVNAETPLGGARGRLPLVRDVGSAVAAVVRGLCEAKQRQHVLDYDDLLIGRR